VLFQVGDRIGKVEGDRGSLRHGDAREGALGVPHLDGLQGAGDAGRVQGGALALGHGQRLCERPCGHAAMVTGMPRSSRPVTSATRVMP
jgi:hypothetical protein